MTTKRKQQYAKLRACRVAAISPCMPLLRAVTQQVCNQHDMEICGAFMDPSTTLREVLATKPDVILLDVASKRSDAHRLIESVKSNGGNSHVLVICDHNDAVTIARLVEAGTAGFLRRSDLSVTLALSIRLLHGGNGNDA